MGGKKEDMKQWEIKLEKKAKWKFMNSRPGQYLSEATP